MPEPQIINENHAIPSDLSFTTRDDSEAYILPWNRPMHDFQSRSRDIIFGTFLTSMSTVIVYTVYAVIYITLSISYTLKQDLDIFLPITPSLGSVVFSVLYSWFYSKLGTPSEQTVFSHCVFSGLQLLSPILNVIIFVAYQDNIYVRAMMISITFIYLWAIFYFFLSAISFYKFFSQHHRPMTEYIYLSTLFFYLFI